MEENFKFRKSFGQNFLIDNNVIHNIVDNSNIDKDTLVIEIGPGSGVLSNEIIPLSGYSLLYEIDDRLESVLNDKLSCYNNYSLKIGDFLDVDLKKDLDEYNYSKLYVVANLPYYITTPIIMKFINENVLPDKMVIMIQKEVASRLSAKVNSREYGSFTVLLNYYYDIKKLFDVSKNCFIPKPNVDSSVICLELKKDIVKVKDIDLFKRFVRDCFKYKRKNLRNNLSGYELEKIEKILKKHDLSLNSRAENVNLESFIEIVNNL